MGRPSKASIEKAKLEGKINKDFSIHYSILNTEAAKPLLEKGNLILNADTTETRKMLNEINISKDELRFLLGLYKYLEEDKDELDILKDSKIKIPKDITTCIKSLESLKKKKWISGEGLNKIETILKAELLNSTNTEDFITTHTLKALKNILQTGGAPKKNAALSLLVVCLVSICMIKTGNHNYPLITDFLREQGIVTFDDADSIIKIFERGEKDYEHLRKVAVINKMSLPIQESRVHAESPERTLLTEPQPPVTKTRDKVKSSKVNDSNLNEFELGKLVKKAVNEKMQFVSSLPFAICALLSEKRTEALDEFKKKLPF